MLPDDGRVVAPPEVAPADWCTLLSGEPALLALAPGSGRGWFGGRAIVAWAPETLNEGVLLPAAAAEIERTYAGGAPILTATLLAYDGSATVARYMGGLVWSEEGWRVWGVLEGCELPEVAVTAPNTLPASVPLAADVTSDLDRAGFHAGVSATREAISAGDVYVLNLTRRLRGTPSTSPEVAFATLTHRTQAEMSAFWRTPGVTIASASPERFIRLSGARVEVCPVKGTRPRGEGAADCIMVSELAGSEKERAEHVMIVDLERNDLGMVCRPGTVVVDPLFEIATTPYCHQMVSSVSGLLRTDATFADLLAATFPCGSVTGAPKIAATRIIASLEASPRGAYTGALVVAVPGEVDSSVIIRTAEYSGDVVRWGTGGGITADSDPAEEWLETVLKATPFLGDGLPAIALRETCRVVHGHTPLLARHLARLAKGGCGATVLARVRSAAAEAIESYGEAAGYGHLSVTVAPTGEVTASVTAMASSLDVPGYPALFLVRAATPLLPEGAAKPADRAAWDDAQRQALDAGAHQAVLVDARETVIDGATASVWIRVGKRLLTPCAPPAIHGVARGVILDIATRCGYRAEECEISVALLAQADEVFFSNALAGVVPARGRSGAAADALAGVFGEVFGGGGSAQDQK